MTAKKKPDGAATTNGSEQTSPGLHPGNELNDLTGKEWIKSTKSWFVCDSHRYSRNRDVELHPARFPEEMVAEFIRFFTKRGQWVLDPFTGSGATLVACQEAGRSGVGIEVSQKYAEKVRRRINVGAAPCGRPDGNGRPRRGAPTDGIEGHILCADARRVADPELWQNGISRDLQVGPDGLPQFDFVITSPPYWQMLRTSRGGVVSTHKKRAAAGLDTHYSDSPDDLGNIQDYDEFIEEIGCVFDGCARVLKEGKYLVAIVQNLRAPSGEVLPLAWDVGRRISQALLFQGERIWCQNSKKLGIWGYPKVFVPNYHHHYCLIFRK